MNAVEYLRALVVLLFLLNSLLLAAYVRSRARDGGRLASDPRAREPANVEPGIIPSQWRVGIVSPAPDVRFKEGPGNRHRLFRGDIRRGT